MPLPLTHSCAQPTPKAATADVICRAITERGMAANNNKKDNHLFASDKFDGGTKGDKGLENCA